jgi:hypothetical protein
MADRYYAEHHDFEWVVIQRRAAGELMDLKVCGDTGELWATKIAAALNRAERSDAPNTPSEKPHGEG